MERKDKKCNNLPERQIYLKCDNGFEATVRDTDLLESDILFLNKHQGLSGQSYYSTRGDVGFGHEVNQTIKRLINAPIDNLCDKIYKIGINIKELGGLARLDRVIKELND